jgi:hypothetical protein
MNSENIPEIVETIQEMQETDRVFFSLYRFIDPSDRTRVMMSHLQNTRDILAILRACMIAQPVPLPPRESIVVSMLSLPVTIDPSGNFMDPVYVQPTHDQLARGTEENVSVLNETCAICQESLTLATRIRGCGHCFHANCITNWFSINTRCPICRHDIRE